MGIRFTANTWRAPLQLIDCWLPAPQPCLAESSVIAPRLLQRFAKAGWLHRASKPGTAPIGGGPRSMTSRHISIETKTSVQQRSIGPTCSGRGNFGDGRLVLSGPIDQVCAELDRLAALEQRMFR
jgi:hypothetical protein